MGNSQEHFIPDYSDLDVLEKQTIAARNKYRRMAARLSTVLDHPEGLPPETLQRLGGTYGLNVIIAEHLGRMVETLSWLKDRK